MRPPAEEDGEKESRYQEWFDNRFDAFKRGYKSSLEWVMERHLLALIVWGALARRHDLVVYRGPEGFLPIGDSGMIRGVFLAAEGSSPAQMQGYQAKLEAIFKKDPAVDQAITVTGIQNSQITTSMGLYGAPAQAGGSGRPSRK